MLPWPTPQILAPFCDSPHCPPRHQSQQRVVRRHLRGSSGRFWAGEVDPRRRPPGGPGEGEGRHLRLHGARERGGDLMCPSRSRELWRVQLRSPAPGDCEWPQANRACGDAAGGGQTFNALHHGLGRPSFLTRQVPRHRGPKVARRLSGWWAHKTRPGRFPNMSGISVVTPMFHCWFMFHYTNTDVN